ncbi:MAG: hypothetical protein ABIS14_12615 [Sphingomonas sp.]
MTRTIFIGIATVAASVATPAMADDRHKSITPYIEIGQVLTADLNSGDVLTYSTLAAGVDASVQTKRVEAQVSYRYERRFSYDKKVGDDDIHSGLARVAAHVAPGLTVEAGALATRTRSDIRGAAPGVLAGNVDNISQVYSAYAGPTYATQAGPLTVGASYRIGYTKVETPTGPTAPAGSPPLDRFDQSNSQVAGVSVGAKAGTALPVGVTLAAQWQRDDATQLDQRFDDKNVRGDVVAPIAPTVALTAGAGYEKVTVSQRDPVLDTAGVPVTDANGRFVTDKSSPRRIAYQTDGLIYDAGVIWRPSRRTTLEARVGKRYGGVSYTGSFSYAAASGVGVQIGVYDSVDTFGHQLESGIASLPTEFIAQRDAFGQQFSGCVAGTAGTAGGCLNGVFQSISTSAYRTRGVDAVLSVSGRRLSYGGGIGYSQRRFYSPGGTGFTIDGVTDRSVYADAFGSLALTRQSGISTDLFVNYYESGIAAASSVTSVGATGSYYHNFGHLGATASLGIYSFSQKDIDNQVSGQAQVGMRYQF